MKRRNTARGGKLALRQALNMTVETLELRRMLSYSLESTIIDTEDGGAHHNFGAGIATNGNLALVSSPGVFGATTPDNGETFEEFDTTEGRVSLVDTTTGEILQTFQNPAGDVDGTGFGASVAFVDGKIAISAPNSVKVYIYDDYADDTPDRVYEYGGDPFAVFATQIVAHGDDLLVSVLQDPGTGESNNGSILRFDLDSPSAFPADTIFNPFGAGITNDQFGSYLASDGSTIYAYYKTLGSEEFTFTGHVVAMDTAGNTIHKYDGLDGDNQFGWAIATSGDNVLIGAPLQNAVYLLDQEGDELAQYDFPEGRDQSFAGSFGVAIAVNGDRVLIADPSSEEFFPANEEIPFDYSIMFGAAHVFDLNSGEYLTTIENPNRDEAPDPNQADQGAGFSLCVAPLPDGKFLIASPWSDNANGVDGGEVYVYAPAVSNQPPTASITAPASVAENSSVNLDASNSSDPDNDIVSYLWDLDNDGQYDDASGINASFTPDLADSYPIGLKVIDSANQESTASVTIGVTEVSPTANAGGNKTAITGQVLTFNGSATGVDAIVSYQWDFSYDGNPANFNAEAAGSSVNHSYSNIGAYTVALRVTDDDGQTAIATATVTVNNTAPSAALSAPGVGVRQQSLAFTGSFSDPDANDPHEVSWNFGDGSVVAFHSTADANALTPQHAYLTSGTYVVTVSVRDSHGAVSSAQSSLTISATAVVGPDLYIGGVVANDKITITKSTGGVFVTTQEKGKTFYPVTGKVIIYGGDGADSIQSNSDVPVAFEIYGGAGIDTIKGGLANDILVGGDGKDQLTGNDGRDILIGGTGNDALTGSGGDDLLIAGKTSFDNNPGALRLILAEWGSTRTYTERVNNLRNGTGSAVRANGSTFLQADVTVFNDGISDTLTGGMANDWFFANVDGTAIDKVDLKSGEVLDDVDVVLL